MNWVEFLRKTLTKASKDETELTGMLYNHFLAVSLRAKNESKSYDVLLQLGNPHHQTYFFKHPNEEICVIRIHAMKSRKGVYKLGFSSKLLPLVSGNWKQEESDVLIG